MSCKDQWSIKENQLPKIERSIPVLNRSVYFITVTKLCYAICLYNKRMVSGIKSIIYKASVLGVVGVLTKLVHVRVLIFFRIEFKQKICELNL